MVFAEATDLYKESKKFSFLALNRTFLKLDPIALSRFLKIYSRMNVKLQFCFSSDPECLNF
jgi:hypothetical protein